MSRHAQVIPESNINQSAASITSCFALKFDASPRSRHFTKTQDFDNFSSLRSFVHAERFLCGTDDPARRSSLKCDTWKWHKLHQNETINSKWPTSCSVFVMAPRDFFVSCDMIQMCTDFRACTCNRMVGLEAQSFVGGAVASLGHAPFSTFNICWLGTLVVSVQSFATFRVRYGVQ